MGVDVFDPLPTAPMGEHDRLCGIGQIPQHAAARPHADADREPKHPDRRHELARQRMENSGEKPLAAENEPGPPQLRLVVGIDQLCGRSPQREAEYGDAERFQGLYFPANEGVADCRIFTGEIGDAHTAIEECGSESCSLSNSLTRPAGQNLPGFASLRTTGLCLPRDRRRTSARYFAGRNNQGRYPQPL